MNTNKADILPANNIPAFEILYQQALQNGEQFHVLKDIREAIKKLRLSINANTPLAVEKILTHKRIIKPLI